MAPETSRRLCEWLGVDHVPFPPERVNESHGGLAAIHQRLPFLSRMPYGIKSALRPLAKYLPGKSKPVLSPEDAQMIREQYAESNARTEALI